MKLVNIEDEDVLDLGLGRSIYSKAQVEEFLKFQDSQGTRRAYLTETAELAYGGRGEDGSWGLGLGEQAKEALIDTVGWSLIPLYRLTGPIAIFIMFGLLVWSIVKIVLSVIIRACSTYRARSVGLWLLGAFWSLPFQMIISPVRWASEAATDVADGVAIEMESQAHMDDEKRRMAGYPSTMLREMSGGHGLYSPYVPWLGAEAEDSI
jgi:hypothetical protein